MVKKKTKKKIKDRKLKVNRKIVKRKIKKKELKEPMPQIETFDIQKEKKNNILPVLFVAIIIVAGIGILLYTYRDVFLINYFKDVLEAHPELESNEKIMEFLNIYENRVFREQTKGDYLYITIWSRDRKGCIAAVEDSDKNIKQIIEPKSCDEASLKKI